MQDIKIYNTFTKIEPVNKGWSSDKKHHIETADGRKLLLRVADISEYDHFATGHSTVISEAGHPLSF